MQGGTRVTAHCFTSQGARNAIEGGVTCIEHGALIDQDTFKLMGDKGIHFVPTLLIQDVRAWTPLARSSRPAPQPPAV